MDPTVCAACRFRRMKCTPECPFAPYFPADKPERWSAVFKQYGGSNLAKLLSELKESDRENAVNTLVHDAVAREKDPVYGSVGLLSVYQKRHRELLTQLDMAKKELTTYGVDPQAMIMAKEEVIRDPKVQEFLKARQLAAAAQQLQQQARVPNNAAFDSNIAQAVMGGHGGAIGGNNSNNAAIHLPVNFPHNNMAQAVMDGHGGAVGGSNAAYDFPRNKDGQTVMDLHGAAVGGNNSNNAAFDLPAKFPLYNMAQQAEILEAQQLAAAQQLQQQHQAMVPGTFNLSNQQGRDTVGGNNSNNAAFGFPHNNNAEAVIGWHGGAVRGNNSNAVFDFPHNNMAQEQEFLEAARLQKQYDQAKMPGGNFLLPNQQGGGAVVGGNNSYSAAFNLAPNNMTQGLIQDPQDQELLEAHDQLAAAAAQQQEQDFQAMLWNYKQQQQQHEEMMRLISFHGGGESSSSQALFDQMQQQQPPQQRGELYHHHVPQHPPVEAQQQHMLSTPPQSQAQQRRSDHEEGRSLGPLICCC